MGGPGSGRWGMTLTRQTTEGLPRLDVRALARAGTLQPGVTATVRWEGGASVTTSVAADAPDCLVMVYTVDLGGWVPVREEIQVTRTSCTLGGQRCWVLCPGCAGRRAVLYALSGRFRCRACYRLAYQTARDT